MKLRLASLFTVLGAAAVVTAALPTVAMGVVSPQLTAGSAAQTSTLSLHVDSCERCPVTLTQALEGRKVWQSATKRVQDGDVTFTVPIARTRGMSITVSPRWSDLDAVPLVAFRYAGTEVGQVIPNSLAATETRGTACWAGTSAKAVSMDIRVVSYAHRTQSGDPGRAIRVWSKTTRHAMLPYLDAYKGSLGTQDVVFCKG